MKINKLINGSPLFHNEISRNTFLGYIRREQIKIIFKEFLSLHSV